MLTDAGLPKLKWSPLIPHAPRPKQHAFLLLEAEQALYGGATGGGKSDALLMSGLQWTDVPNYSALLLRRTWTDLEKPNAIMDRSLQWMRGVPGTSWNANTRTWTFDSGARLSFGYIAKDEDVYQYQSAEYQFIGFDELTQFSEFQYRYMMSRLRRLAGSPVPIRMRAATNPGGKGHRWVSRMFPVEPGAKPQDHEGRVFLPSTLDDMVGVVDTETYSNTLKGLDPYTYQQLRFGSWTSRPPGDWAYDHDHIDAALYLGSVADERRLNGELAPVGGVQYFGADYGEFTQVIVAWPLEDGGWYIVGEHLYERGEPDVEAHSVLAVAQATGDYRAARLRYDASKPESARLMARTFRQQKGESYGKLSGISFAKYKRLSVRHLRGLLFRAWLQKEEASMRGVVAISPSGCPVLAEQLYTIERERDDQDSLIKKKNKDELGEGATVQERAAQGDEGNDALLALIAPGAKRPTTPAPTPAEVVAEEVKRAEARVSVLAAG